MKHYILTAALAFVAACAPQAPDINSYVPAHAVMAHRGSTYWAPEETESAWRWAREMGADYLESDLQCTKDGVILANHDVNLTRTTDIEEVFGPGVPATRRDFYISLGFSAEDADAQLECDAEGFEPYHASSYYYAELLTLDAGSWFNQARPDQARPAFAGSQYVSALQDQIAYAEGRMLKRDAAGRRVLPYCIKPCCEGKTLAQIRAEAKENGKYMEFLDYDFAGAYVDDPADSGHRPGIYIEFKEPEVNPEDMEQRVYDILDACGWNIITSAPTETEFYKDGMVQVGKTRGKVILQTFSTASLVRANAIFKGRLPMCFLLWPPCPEDIPGGDLETEEGFRAILQWAKANGANISGPSISGAPNNYAELNHAWQADLVHEAGMLNHPYSFDSLDQMEEQTARSDGFFTNRSDLTIQYLIDHGLRAGAENPAAPATVPDPVAALVRLGY
ncbi:MAG: glycerophosphodiester phosphodiesterase [Bacteroidales bacterium]|nr:glycerophosphodiester phosphodiesterase [Bacteroidales bacterium]